VWYSSSNADSMRLEHFIHDKKGIKVSGVDEKHLEVQSALCCSSR
jgi:hypothetical protein